MKTDEEILNEVCEEFGLKLTEKERYQVLQDLDDKRKKRVHVIRTIFNWVLLSTVLLLVVFKIVGLI